MDVKLRSIQHDYKSTFRQVCCRWNRPVLPEPYRQDYVSHHPPIFRRGGQDRLSAYVKTGFLAVARLAGVFAVGLALASGASLGVSDSWCRRLISRDLRRAAALGCTMPALGRAIQRPHRGADDDRRILEPLVATASVAFLTYVRTAERAA